MSYETNQNNAETELIPLTAYVPEDTAWLIQNIFRAVQDAYPYADPRAPTRMLGEIIARGTLAELDINPRFREYFLRRIGEPFAIEPFLAPHDVTGTNVVPLDSLRERIVVREEEEDRD